VPERSALAALPNARIKTNTSSFFTANTPLTP
jgi:hypothetical protein